jgi:hypothetical protein
VSAWARGVFLLRICGQEEAETVITWVRVLEMAFRSQISLLFEYYDEMMEKSRIQYDDCANKEDISPKDPLFYIK